MMIQLLQVHQVLSLRKTFLTTCAAYPIKQLVQMFSFLRQPQVESFVR